VKYFIICLLSIAIFSCNNSANQMQKTNKVASTDSVIDNAGLTGNTTYALGARLIAANDCLGCHKINEKAIAPSYDSIAAKYALTQGNIENLSYKIIKGGKGAWGETAMTPHPNLQPLDAAEMVKYILSLRTHQ
jgi:cytochrome c